MLQIISGQNLPSAEGTPTTVSNSFNKRNGDCCQESTRSHTRSMCLFLPVVKEDVMMSSGEAGSLPGLAAQPSEYTIEKENTDRREGYRYNVYMSCR